MCVGDADPPPGAERWEGHWRAYDEATRRNPAQRYRRSLIYSVLERAAARPLRLLDLGCGQGDFLGEARMRFPDAELVGIDLSLAGLELARQRVPGARFHRVDFSGPDPFPAELRGFATHVVCSEVLEHLDEPRLLLRKAAPLLAPGGELIVTVPGGPRSAFDVHIGHRRHYSPSDLEALVCEAGYLAVSVRGAGFPFFNAYKLAIISRGERLSRDVDQAQPLPRSVAAVMAAFDWLFRFNVDRTGLGWQTVGVFRRG